MVSKPAPKKKAIPKKPVANKPVVKAAKAPKKVAPKKAPAKKAPAKKAKKYSSDDDSDVFMVETVIAPVPARARSGRAAAKKVVYAIDLSDSESEAEFDDGEDSDF